MRELNEKLQKMRFTRIRIIGLLHDIKFEFSPIEIFYYSSGRMWCGIACDDGGCGGSGGGNIVTVLYTFFFICHLKYHFFSSTGWCKCRTNKKELLF